MSYCAIVDVQALNPKRTYGAATTPTSTQVTALIAQIAAEIDAILEAQGYTVPVTSPATFVTSLLTVNAYGVAALAEAAMFPETTAPGETAHWSYLEKKYQAWLKDLRAGIVPSSLSRSEAASNAASNYTEDTDQENYPDSMFAVSSVDKDF